MAVRCVAMVRVAGPSAPLRWCLSRASVACPRPRSGPRPLRPAVRPGRGPASLRLAFAAEVTVPLSKLSLLIPSGRRL